MQIAVMLSIDLLLYSVKYIKNNNLAYIFSQYILTGFRQKLYLIAVKEVYIFIIIFINSRIFIKTTHNHILHFESIRPSMYLF